jgi:FkbM family methyltransferase
LILLGSKTEYTIILHKMLIPAQTVIDILNQRNISIKGVLHIGAHDCEELGFYSQLGLSPDKVIWIDAIQRKVDEAKARDIPNVFQAVVTDKDDELVTFHITNNVQSSSVLDFGSHATNYPGVNFIADIKLKTITIDTFFLRNGLSLKNCEYWNFDIQGAEMLALKGAKIALEFPKAIYLEVNTEEVYKGCAKMDEIDSFLKTHGFERVVTNITPYGWGDALYIR